jgi:glyoxylate/hydroxypyruvate reductase A
MAVLFHCPWENADDWFDALRAAMPGEDLRRWPDVGDPAEIDFAIVWQLPPGQLRAFPHLKGISSMGAGVDGLMADPTLPDGVPVARLVDPIMSARMAEYACATVLYYHLKHDVYAAQQRQAHWQRHAARDAPDRRVGVLGLGAMGLAAARALRGLGFDVAGWSRSPREVAGLTCLHGSNGFDAILGRSEILLALLPRTSQTIDLLDAQAFAAMPSGSYLINCARGDIVVDDDLLAALASGQLAGATLDVMREEPLPKDHTFWHHPEVRVTPHVSSLSEPVSGTRILAEQVQRARRGEPLQHLVDVAKGY